MIDVQFSKQYKSTGMVEVKLKVTGHANQDVKGKDIICAAISIVTHTLADIVKEHKEVSQYVKHDTKGEAIIETTLNAKDINYKAINSAFQFSVRSIVSIAKEYPEYVSYRYNGQ